MRLNRLAALLLAAVCYALPGGPTDHKPEHSYVIASPNTRSSLNDGDAQSGLNSFEQTNATAVADRIACSLTHSVHIGDALGVYDDSSENSFIVETDLQQKQAEYLAALIGRYAHQEFVLLFVARAGGRDRLLVIRTKEPLGFVLTETRKLHLAPLTVRTEEAETEVWLIDTGDKPADKLKILQEDLKAAATVTEGSAELLGNEDRSQAAVIFQQKVDAFEKHRQRLSSNIWSRRWHDATAPTCSTKMPSAGGR